MGDHSLLENTATQSRHPWRAVVRTLFAFVVGFAPMIPGLVDATGTDVTLGWGAAALAVSGVVTRLLAAPAVNAFLALYVPWLAAEPARRVTVGTPN